MVLMIFFINIAPRLSNGIPDINVSPNHFWNNIPSPQNSLFFNPTDHDEAIKICASLKAGASPGYDDIKPDIVKSMSHLLAYPLFHIFNLSMPLVSFLSNLSQLKSLPFTKLVILVCVTIITLFLFSLFSPRSLNASFIRDFITISLINIYSILVNLVSKVIFFIHGCVRGNNDNIFSHLDKGEHTAGIFLDLSKSFDMISHDILLTKLHHYSVRGNDLD